jgi:hypothetical protein
MLSFDRHPLKLFFEEVSVLREQEAYNPPDSALESLARCLYPAIRSYFESEEGKLEFAEWQARKSANLTLGEVKPNEPVGRAA